MIGTADRAKGLSIAMAQGCERTSHLTSDMLPGSFCSTSLCSPAQTPDFCTTASHGYRPRFLQAWSVAQSLHNNTMRHPERGSRNMSTW